MISIVVADDHQLIREGIRKTLVLERDIDVVREAWDLPSLLAALAERHVDMILLDLGLCPPDELAVLRIVRERFSLVRVLVISAHPESRFGVACLREGASGYVAKSMTADVIARAVRKVNAGGRYVSETLADLLADELTARKTLRPHEMLTERESQVFGLLALGLSIKQVAGRLDISISSANTYRTRIFAKMTLNTNTELVRYAIKQGLVS